MGCGSGRLKELHDNFKGVANSEGFYRTLGFVWGGPGRNLEIVDIYCYYLVVDDI